MYQYINLLKSSVMNSYKARSDNSALSEGVNASIRAT